MSYYSIARIYVNSDLFKKNNDLICIPLKYINFINPLQDRYQKGR
jgi:hypothetical protein